MSREAPLVQRILNYFNHQEDGKSKAIKLGPLNGETGTPDILACKNGQMYLIETKAPGSGQKPTKLQFKRLEQWQRTGAITFWTNNFNHFIKIMES